MTDFGFDAFALDSVGEAGHAHPLEIARDLIAHGKPRSALDVLSDHHEALADDPEYLLLCAEAWRADGDALRAQQALMGAARLAPDDPRPLAWLAELFADLGQTDKAGRARAKAEALEIRASHHDSLLPEGADDLIALAERQERGAQASLTPKQIASSLVALAAVAGIVVGIAWITAPDDDSSRAENASEREAPIAFESPPQILGDMVSDDGEALPPAAAAEVQESPPAHVEVEVAEVAAAVVPEATVTIVADPPAAARPPRARRRPSAPPERAEKQREKIETGPQQPDPKIVQGELASMSPAELTARGETLEAEGHTSIAATYYRRALDIDPDYAPALVGIGGSTLRAKKYAEAMKTATRALELARGVDARPGLEAGAIYQLGRVHYERGERDAAKRLLRQSISLPRTPAAAWFYLGEVLSAESSLAAREAYEKYLELVPEGHLADRARRAIQ